MDAHWVVADAGGIRTKASRAVRQLVLGESSTLNLPLVDLLQLEDVGSGLLIGHQPAEDSRQRIFGGQLVAQALMAAAHTVEQKLPHSIHAYFVRPGDPTIPVLFQVAVVRDGRRFARRRINAIQRGATIFEAMASFGTPADGPNYQRGMPDAEPPERVIRVEDQLEPYADEHEGWWVRRRAFDMRYVTPPPRVALDNTTKPAAVNRLWLRADWPVPRDPVLMSCLLAYVSDLTLLDSVMIPAGRTSRGPGPVASLDHALWFHRPVDLNDWLLYDQHSPSAADGRGLACGALFSRSGELVCSVTQEGHLG